MNKIKKIVIMISCILLFPISVFAADWEVGGGVDSEGNYGISVGIGSGSGLGSGGWAISNPYGLPEGSILGIVSNLLFWLLSIFAIAGIVGFIISGIIYLVSTGDDTTITRAKTAMKWSIVGIIVGLSGYVIMQAVTSLLSGANNTF